MRELGLSAKQLSTANDDAVGLLRMEVLNAAIWCNTILYEK